MKRGSIFPFDECFVIQPTLINACSVVRLTHFEMLKCSLQRTNTQKPPTNDAIIGGFNAIKRKTQTKRT